MGGEGARDVTDDPKALLSVFLLGAVDAKRDQTILASGKARPADPAAFPDWAVRGGFVGKIGDTEVPAEECLVAFRELLELVETNKQPTSAYCKSTKARNKRTCQLRIDQRW